MTGVTNTRFFSVEVIDILTGNDKIERKIGTSTKNNSR
jgi:hypothetical protein